MKCERCGHSSWLDSYNYYNQPLCKDCYLKLPVSERIANELRIIAEKVFL